MLAQKLRRADLGHVVYLDFAMTAAERERAAAMRAHPSAQTRVQDVEPEPFELAVWEITEGLAQLLISKQKDYGPHAIANAPGGALNGVNVRIHDKISRIRQLTSTFAMPNHEAIEDSYRDLANYAIIALLILADEWPTS